MYNYSDDNCLCKAQTINAECLRHKHMAKDCNCKNDDQHPIVDGKTVLCGNCNGIIGEVVATDSS